MLSFLFLSPRYFKQDSAIEIAARDTLVKGYIKLKLNTTDGVPLDDEEDPDAAAGEMNLDKVGMPTRGRSRCRTAVLAYFAAPPGGFLGRRSRILERREGDGGWGTAKLLPRAACLSCLFGRRRYRNDQTTAF